MTEAKSFDDIAIRPEHIILSIINDNDNECIKVFKTLGVNTRDLHDNISDYLRKNDLTPRILQNVRARLPFSDESKLIFKAVDKECDDLLDKIIDTTHIMLAILATKTSVTKILSESKITYLKFKTIILDEKTNEIMNERIDDDFNDDFEEHERFKKPKKKGEQTKTPVLDNFCRDVSKAAEKGEIDPVVGRGKEIKRISQILSRRKKNNPILIGEPGVGKTSIVEGLAQLIKDGNAPRTIANKRIFTLDLASIVAGTKYRGQFEERMKAILEECKANPDITLFIDELHTIIGAGNSSGSLDASNIFKPALARGEIQIIGATTLDEYREHIEKDGALTRRFQQILVEEPTLDETKIILMNIKEKYEKHHNVIYTDDAIDECVKLSHRYIMERSMPDKAIDVLDEAGAATNVTIEKPSIIKDLEIKKSEIKIKKTKVVAEMKYEEAAKLRDEEKRINDKLEIAIKDWNNKLEKKATIIGIEQISEVVSTMTGIPLTKISTQESKKLMSLDKDLMGRVIGQDDAVTKVVKAIKRNRIGIKDKTKPIGSFIFLGPTGVGKCICGDTQIVIRDKTTNLVEKIDINELIKRINHDKSLTIYMDDTIKHEIESFKKITKTTKISDYDVLTDDGYVDIVALHETIPYEVYHLKLSDGKELKCADNHIVFYKDNIEEVFVKNLNIGDKILVEENGVLGESEVIEVTNLGYEEVMYDLELIEGSNRRYYTNGILSHNTYLAKLLAEHVFGDEEALVRMDMSEYMEKHSVSRLVGCFTPETLISMSDGKLKPIVDVIIGESVITHNGNIKKVVDKYKYENSGLIDSYKIANTNILLECTKQHEIFAIKPCYINNRINKTSYDVNNAKFYHSNELKIGDILMYPKKINIIENNNITIDLGDFCNLLPKYKVNNNYVWCYETMKFNRNIKIDEKFLRFIGYYLSEGGVTKSMKEIKFTFNIKETEYVSELCELINEIFGNDIKPIIIETPERNSVKVIISSKVIGVMLSELFGRTTYEKKLPEWIMGVNSQYIHNLLETLIYGDGCKTQNRKIVYKTVSRDLATQMNTLLKKIGYSTQFNLIKKEKPYSDIYHIILTGLNIIKLNTEFPNLRILESDVKPKNIQRLQHQDDNYFYYQIIDKTEKEHNDFVYDLSIEDDSTYIANNMCVHNSPPGYVGYDQGGQLTEKVRRKPHCVILFDEIEKAHEDVFNILLQLLDDGQLTDGLGRKVNFKNALVILTSNIGVKELNQFGSSVGFQTAASIAGEDERARSIIEKALKKKFRPEFLNRIDESIIFNGLKEEDIHKIIYKEIEKLESRIGEVGYKLKINKAAIEFLAKEGYDEAYGARPLGRTIQKYVEDPIADEILSGNVKDGDIIKITFDKVKNEILVKSDKSNKIED